MATSKGGYVSGGFDILKAPNAPTITSVATNIGSATVAFTAPADVGGGAITSYTITAVNESTGASTGAVGTASPITISPGGGTFKIRAAATNIYGPGRVSQYDTGNQIYSGASLWGWGRNDVYQLGNGTIVNRSSPVQIGALATWASVSAGPYNTAAVRTDGTLWTWGLGTYGALGLNSTTNRSSPTQVGALSNWSSVSVAQAGSSAPKMFAITTANALYAWGRNENGELGLNDRIARSSPAQVGALTNWSQVSAGSVHAASIKTDGTLWSWGINSTGAVGDNTRINRSSPVQIGALTNWSRVSCSYISAAIKVDGSLWAWGDAASYALGDGTVIDRSSPIQIGALTDWAQISAGTNGWTAVKTNGTLWAVGGNSFGIAGNGLTLTLSSPTQIGALTNWSRVSRSTFHALSVKNDGTLWSWGRNNFGQLGQNIATATYRSSPVQVGSLTSWYQVSASSNTSFALYGVV